MQLEFDFMADIAKAESEKKQTEFRAKWNNLGDNFSFDKPPEEIKNDNDRLRLYEWKYRHGEPVYLTRIYFLCEKLARKILRKITTEKKIFVDSDAFEEKAMNAATYIIEQYLQRPDFQLLRPTSYIFLRIKHELFYKTKADELVDFLESDDFTNLQKEMENA